jgi:hypothetical protein
VAPCRRPRLRKPYRGAIEPEGEQAFDAWTSIHEIPEGNWAGGEVVYYRQVKGLVADDAS